MKAARTPAREIPGRGPLICEGRGAGEAPIRSHSPGGGGPPPQKKKIITHKPHPQPPTPHQKKETRPGRGYPPASRFLFRKGRGAGMTQFRSHSPGEEDPRPEQRTTAQKRGSPMAEHPAPGFTPPHQTSAKNRSKRRKNPRTDVLAYHPSGDFPTMMRITRTIQPIGRRTCPERSPRKRDSS